MSFPVRELSITNKFQYSQKQKIFSVSSITLLHLIVFLTQKSVKFDIQMHLFPHVLGQLRKTQSNNPPSLLGVFVCYGLNSQASVYSSGFRNPIGLHPAAETQEGSSVCCLRPALDAAFRQPVDVVRCFTRPTEVASLMKQFIPHLTRKTSVWKHLWKIIYISDFIWRSLWLVYFCLKYHKISPPFF